MKHKLVTFQLTAVMLGYGLASSALFAETAPSAEEQKKKPQDGATHLPAMVVDHATPSPIAYQEKSSTGALFADTPLLKTPFSVAVYNEQLIEDQRAFKLEDLLKNDPSIAIQGPPTHGFPLFGSRGFRIDPFTGYRVDGLPVMGLLSPYLDDKSRVELLKGPSAMRYGFMPSGGSINLVRKKPTPERSVSLSTDVNTFGNVYGQMDASDSSKDGKFGIRAVVAADEFDSFYDRADGDRQMGSVYLAWKPLENVNIWAAISGQEFNRNFYHGPLITGDGHILNTGRDTNLAQDWSGTDQNSRDLAMGADIEINENWKIRAAVNRQDSDRLSLFSYASDGQLNGDFTYNAIQLDQEFESIGSHIHLEGEFDTGFLKHEVVLGAQHRTYETDQVRMRSFGFAAGNVYNWAALPKPTLTPWGAPTHFEYEEVGAFLTDTIKFNDYFSTLLGVRYGAIDTTDQDDSAVSPTAALMFAPVQNVNTYVMYTQGLQDGGFAPAPGFAPQGAVKSEQWEVGAKAELYEGRLWSELALFHIEQTNSSDNKILTPRTNQGVEFTVRGKVTEELQAGISTMLIDSEQQDTGTARDGKTPAYVPNYQLNTWAVLDIPQVPGLALLANARFVGSQYMDYIDQQELLKTDSYMVFDLGARYRFRAAEADWTVRLNIANLFDERYYESGEYESGTWGGFVSYGAPRSANLSLQVEF